MSRCAHRRSGCCAEETGRNAALPDRSGPALRESPHPTKAGTAACGEFVEGREDGGKAIEGVVVDRARRRCGLRPDRWVDAGVGVARGRPGDVVFGSDAAVRY